MIEQTEKVRGRDKEPGGVNWRLILGVLLIALVILLLLLWRQPPETLYFVEQEVLLSGPPAEIDAVVGTVERQLADQGIELFRVERIELPFLKQVPAGCGDLPFDPAAEGGFVIDRYRFTAGALEVKDVVSRLLEAAGDDGLVHPEPNYLTSSPWSIGGSPWSIGGSPWSIGGSPWSIGGSPWSIGGSPWSIGGSPWSIGGSSSGSEVRSAANKAFHDQWAFGEHGIRLAGASAKRPQGHGVLVGIFDTSPFPVNVSHVFLATDPPFEIELQHVLPGGPFTHTIELADIRDHGLFAAGLVHAVAPASRIRLVRVLDNEGQGDLQTLNRALVAFIEDVVNSQDTASAYPDEKLLRGAVINLSLGVHPPPDAAQQGLPEEIYSLQTILNLAECVNIVTVAAAGNDSAGAQVHHPAQIPASWPSTIGVAASNDRGELACFSNLGDILAPGGDGGPSDSTCQPMFHHCTGDCPYALISLSLASPTGYRYWTGTSFSTPIVSGLAAAVVDGDGGWLSLAHVRQRLEAGGHAATTPEMRAVIIDVESTTP